MSEDKPPKTFATKKLPPTKKAPKPRKWNDDAKAQACDEILTRVASGETVRSMLYGADRERHLPEQSVFFSWLIDDGALTKRYARARAIVVMGWEEEMDALSEKALAKATGAPGTGEAGARVQAVRLQIDTRKWLMAKRLPIFGDSIRQELTGANGGAIKTQSEVSDEALAKIKEAAKIGAAMEAPSKLKRDE